MSKNDVIGVIVWVVLIGAILSGTPWFSNSGCVDEEFYSNGSSACLQYAR